MGVLTAASLIANKLSVLFCSVPQNVPKIKYTTAGVFTSVHQVID